jgi:ABC-type cobalamin/Fe3+-siderophores transport system ATPase subunit
MYLKINNLSFIYNKELFVYTDHLFLQGITIISTLFQLLIRSVTPLSGVISWHGKNIVEYPTIDYLDSIVSIVFQGGVLSYYFTLAQYIELLILNRGDATKELADFYLQALGLQYLLNESITHCSGGEKYKIALFLALIKNTPMLLLDEPTAHLDKTYSIALLSLLKNITDKVILIITHDQLFFESIDQLSYYYL